MDRQEFVSYLKKICPWVNEHTFALFDTYKNTLQLSNKQMNLSRICSDELIYDNYFLASLLPFINLSYFYEATNISVLDIGTGSGIPGIVLKIIYPNIKLTLLEANTKKCNFLNKLVKDLKFSDVTIINNRCEECAQEFKERYDIVTSRAVASLNKILELSAIFAKVKGSIIALKSQNYLSELEDAKNAIAILNLELVNTIETNFIDHFYVTLDFKKINSTDKKYPRSWQKIVSKPL